MRIALTDFELQNVVRASDGSFRTRRGFVSVKTPTSGTEYVAGFSIESPGTTEPWHYLFEQSTTTGVATLRVFTEEFLEVFSHSFGKIQQRPVISYAVANNQLMINSPSFSAPLYGLPGGGLITAVKTDSINPDTTALDIPSGHICSFGDRFPIAEGNALFFNDPPSANNVDPRSYVAQNVVALPGSIYDILQGPEGALYAFTSAGVYSLPSDALAQGQLVFGALSRIPGLETSRSLNAVSADGAVAVLQKDHVVLLPSGKRIDLARRAGRRYYSQAIEIEDLRQFGELYARPGGFCIGFRGKRSFFIDVDAQTSTVSYMTAGASMPLVGTLRSRDGGALHVFSNRVAVCYQRAKQDAFASTDIDGVLSGRVPMGGNSDPVIERVSLAADNIALTNAVFVSGKAKSSTTPTKTTDIIVGTTTWGGENYASKELRTTRHTVGVRTSEASIEVKITGGDRRFLPSLEAEVNGQEPTRRGRNT
jgi:hypothetical protein